MNYYISTIADLNYKWDNEQCKEEITYDHKTGICAKANGLGLELTEYCICDNCENPEKVAVHFRENVNNYTKDLILHAPYNEIYPHAIEPAVVRVAEERLGKAYALCEKFNIPKMVVHANFIDILYFPEWFIPKQIEFWTKFLKHNKGNCIIVLENVLETDPALLTDIVKGVNDKRFKMCMDVGHANIHKGKSVYEWLEEAAPYISHLHIHNNSGPNDKCIGNQADQHKALGNGVIDYERFLKRADELIPELTATIESTEFEESVQWLKEKGFIKA